MQITASEIIETAAVAGEAIEPIRAENLSRFLGGWKNLQDAREALTWADHIWGFKREEVSNDLRSYVRGLEAQAASQKAAA